MVERSELLESEGPQMGPHSLPCLLAGALRHWITKPQFALFQNAGTHKLALLAGMRAFM